MGSGEGWAGEIGREKKERRRTAGKGGAGKRGWGHELGKRGAGGGGRGGHEQAIGSIEMRQQSKGGSRLSHIKLFKCKRGCFHLNG